MSEERKKFIRPNEIGIHPDKIWGWCPIGKIHTWLFPAKCSLTGALMWVSMDEIN